MPTLVGHRGAPTRRLENTVGSLLLARDQGAEAVEFDVRATRDGHPVLLHDRTLERFWGRPELVGELTLAELRELRAAEEPEARLPTLGEVADAVDLRLVVDGKDPDLVPTIVEVLRRHDALARSCFIGEPGVLGEVRRVLPDAEIILSWAGERPPPPELLDTIRPAALNLRWAGLSDETYRAVRELGHQIWTYCVDDATQARRALRLGIDAVITNDLPAVAPVLAGVAEVGR
ncbi:glycerophosphodiester phosphodiesterase family protein [Polymorphospora sp. NPDC050346]|uniref:glycerophosphodiester phosphodiesterase n=1 Tax=Polymorphospora sp. NPDC050346 TaxID=3155780 RepID=UPI0033DED134